MVHSKLILKPQCGLFLVYGHLTGGFNLPHTADSLVLILYHYWYE